ncbi:hypothetical protein [Sphingomonas glaciei]|uniref:GAF domain-containing protein n=1 Tax=Sphingomonas glaciei TaxID=2938948 RepID=A0ABY5MQM3_9SPHN|nr:hypothetical protein [Sphingomonas glaciei]UUR06805.1 hypothetical protein M1K48_07505 [Sphingomonas glaciei]
MRDAELAFLNAPFEADGWLTALRQLSHATGSAITQLCGGGAGPGLTFNYFSEDRHDPHGHLVNPQLYGPENWRINCSTGVARSIQYERHYAAYRSANPCGFYDDAVSDLDLPYGCQSPLIFEADGALVGLALLRSSRDGPCSPEVVDFFAQVARQAHRAVRVEIALGQARGEDMLAGLASSGEMTLLLDRNGRLVAMTEWAEAIFDAPFGLRLDGLAVHLADPREDNSFKAAMMRLLGGDELGGPVVHEGRAGRSEERPDGLWQLFLTRLPNRHDLLGVEAQLALTLRPLLPA